MRRSFGPQIRGGEAASLVRLAHRPIECMNDRFDLLLALDWRNAERFADEIPLRSDSVIIADPAMGEVPDVIRDLGTDLIEVPMKSMAGEIDGGRPNMIALGVLAHWLGYCPDQAGQLIEHTFGGKGEAVVDAAGAPASRSRLLARWAFAWLPLLLPVSLVAWLAQPTDAVAAGSVLALLLVWIGAAAYAVVHPHRGLHDRLAELADIKTDTVGLELEEENLPQRIRRPKKSRPSRTGKKGNA